VHSAHIYVHGNSDSGKFGVGQAIHLISNEKYRNIDHIIGLEGRFWG